MTEFTNRSIDLMEDIARESDNRIAMSRRGYILCTRESDIQPMIEDLAFSLGDDATQQIRVHGTRQSSGYQSPITGKWESAPDGFDVLLDRAVIAGTFPSLDPAIGAVVHIRRGGDISGQQLGQFMLERLRDLGVQRLTGTVRSIATGGGFTLEIEGSNGVSNLLVDKVVNAAGPFAGDISAMLGVNLPIFNVMQQKIALPDNLCAIPRDMPFAIDLDPQQIDWTVEDLALLGENPALLHLARDMPGAIHCRPDGGENGKWIKLGWAYNATPQTVDWHIPLDPYFPEIVLRGASRLNPALRAYLGHLPRQMHHYGGWYTRTDDNWPLIGPMGPEGAFMACALSGHGTMAACATGELAADWIAKGASDARYARSFSQERFSNADLAPSEESKVGLL